MTDNTGSNGTQYVLAADEDPFGGGLGEADLARLRALSYLVVGGEQVARAAVVGHLRALGTRDVIEAAGAGQALALATERPVDIILIGENLPDMTGEDLAWCLKRSGEDRLRRPRAIPFGGAAVAVGGELYLRIFREAYPPNPRNEPPASGFGLH